MAKKKTLSAVIALSDEYSAKLNKIIASTSSAEKKLQSVTGETDKFNKKLKEMGDTSNSTGNKFSGLIGKVTALASAGMALRKAFQWVSQGVMVASLQDVQKNTLSAMVGSDEIGQGLYDYVSDYAKTSILGREDIAKGMMSYLPTTRDFGQLQRLIGMTERLYAKDPTQGSEGAVFAMKEILSGDTMSMRNRYNITGFSGEDIRSMIGSGDTEGALDYIDEKLAQFGASAEVLEKNAGGLSAQMNMLGSNAKTALGENMKPVMEAIIPIAQQLLADLDAGKFQPFFDMLAIGGMVGAQVLGFLAQNASTLALILGIAGAAMLSYRIATFLANGQNLIWTTTAFSAAVAQHGFNVALMACPLTWFIGLLAVVIGLFAAFNSEASKLKDMAELSPDGLPSELDYKMPDFAEALAGTATIPVNVENDSLKVKGTVDIEEDNLKYLLDIAEREYIAKFSTATLAPQIHIQTGDIHETTDMDSMFAHLGDKLQEMVNIEAEGAF